jgi:hypothetical protein
MNDSNNESEPMSHRPPTEIERQKQAISALGDQFSYPLFNGRNAIESARKSGYKNSARAAREIVDNAYEAGARNVHVIFNRVGDSGRGKNQRRDAVSAVAYMDDGPGMIPQMARYALSWGGGTHFENPIGIGRFGFGLPNSSINQTRRVEVYTRTDVKAGWTKAVLDITEERLKQIPPSGLVQIDEPESNAQLPAFVQQHISKSNIIVGTGTIVVWDKPDRLSAKSAAKLRELMLDDFGVVYRYLIDGKRFQITVDGVAVEVVDPLFLTPHAKFYKPAESGGATCTFDRMLTVKQYRDDETGGQHLELLKSADAIRKAKQEASVNSSASVGTMQVRIARFPYGFVGKSVQEERDGVNKDADANKRLQFRKRRRGISFVRANREVDTVDAFPTTTSDRASGLGSWPVLQGYALHWGIEIRFSPNIDDSLGIGNDKQTVNPVEDFWRVLHESEVDRAAREEQRYQLEVRKTAEANAAEEEAKDPNRPNPATEAAAEADAMMGRPEPMPDTGTNAGSSEAAGEETSAVGGGDAGNQPSSEQSGTTEDAGTAVEGAQEGQQTNTDAAGEANNDQQPDDDLLPAEIPVADPKSITYGIEFFESEGGVFLVPEYDKNLRRVAKINTKHPFFRTFYSEILKMRNPKARQVVDLLLLALARGELMATGPAKDMYEYQRETQWSPFLKIGLKILNELQVGDPEEDEEDVD